MAILNLFLRFSPQHKKCPSTSPSASAMGSDHPQASSIAPPCRHPKPKKHWVHHVQRPLSKAQSSMPSKSQSSLPSKALSSLPSKAQSSLPSKKLAKSSKAHLNEHLGRPTTPPQGDPVLQPKPPPNRSAPVEKHIPCHFHSGLTSSDSPPSHTARVPPMETSASSEAIQGNSILDIDLKTASKSSNPHSPILHLKKLPLWKRVSQAGSIHSFRLPKKTGANLADPQKDEADQVEANSIHTDSHSARPTAESPTMTSPRTDSLATTVRETDNLVFKNTASGMAGIGLRDRSSVSLHSLSGQRSHPDSLVPGGMVRPGANYAPCNSSPLSDRVQSVPRIRPHQARRISMPPRPASSHSRASTNQQTHSYDMLNIVPPELDSKPEDLMRLLRGCSSYPLESLPQSSSQSSHCSG